MRARWPETIQGGNTSQMCLLTSLNKEQTNKQKILMAKDEPSATICELEYN